MASIEIPTLEIAGKKVELSSCFPEVEDKYLIPPPSEKFLRLAITSEIRQGYLPNGVRIREEIKASGEKIYSAVFKDRQNARKRDEYTAFLNKRQFDHLWEDVEAVIFKTRHKRHLGIYTVDIDEFKGKLQGKWIAEVEAPSEEDLDEFKKNSPKPWRKEFGSIKPLTNGERKQYTSKVLAYKDWPKETVSA